MPTETLAPYKPPSRLYRTPLAPGFVGGYHWPSLILGFAGLLFTNIFATQFVAALFRYQHALGKPILRADRIALYHPFNWIVWIWRFGSDADSRTRFGVLLGALIIVLGCGASLAIVYWWNLRRNRQLSDGTGDLHGSSRWANPNDIREAAVLGQNEGVYIGGWYDPKKESLHYLRHNGPEHVLAFAPTRSGKGVGLVIPTLLGWNESCVVYDIKGENWEKTAGCRTARGSLCLQFAPCDPTGTTSRFNPLREIRVGTMRDVSDAQNMAEILVKNLENRPNDTHWIDTASMIVTGALLHVCYVAHAQGREANLADLAAFFATYGQSFRETLLEITMANHDPDDKYNWTLPDGRPTKVHPIVLEQVQKMLDKADKEFSSVVSTVNTAFSLYADPLVRQNTAASDFTVDDLVSFCQPVSLYIVVPPSDRMRMAPLLRLMFTLIVNRLTQRMDFDGDGGQVLKRHRLLLLIDEFPTLRKMDLFADALSYMGGYGIKAYLIAQDLQQIIEHYGVHESIVSNCHVRIAYAPNKYETAELLSKMTGTITIEKASFSFSGSRVAPVLDHVSASVQQIQRPLMTPDEVTRLMPAKKVTDGAAEKIVAPGEMLIFISGHPPILGTQILYFLDPAFRYHASVRPPKALMAIEDGVPVRQRPIHLARHRTSHPEPESAPTPLRSGSQQQQPSPPPDSFFEALEAAQDPYYVPPVSPPKETQLS